jgi:hypothetical protein
MTENDLPVDPLAEEAQGGAPPKPAAPAGPGRPGLRPRPGGARPPPPPAKPSKVKAYLMLSILLATVGLSGAIGFKVYKILFPNKKPKIQVKEEAEAAFDKAKDASKEISRIETRVWVMGEDITAAMAVSLSDQLDELLKADDRIKELLDLLHHSQKQDSDEWDSLVNYSLLVKLWILDASDLLELQKNAPEYGGLYIPMHRAMEGLKKAQKEMGEIKTLRDEVLKRNDAAEKEKMRARVKELEGMFAGFRDKLNGLDDYIKKGLARDDLSPKVIKELDDLREDSSKAQMSMKEAKQILADLRE